jgi:hypothetical protein
MKITEHNITNWKLDESELTELIRLAKDEMKKYSDDKATEMFYGMIVGKLIIMKNTNEK